MIIIKITLKRIKLLKLNIYIIIIQYIIMKIIYNYKKKREISKKGEKVLCV